MRHRDPRLLVPDEALIRRRATGEPLRDLARDYGVTHTTLSRYFARPSVKKQIKEAAKQIEVEQQRLRGRRSKERRLERDLRRRAEEQTALERERERRYRAELRQWCADRPAGGSHARWLRDRYQPELRVASNLYSTYDREALSIVSAGGGMEALLAATDIPTLEAAAGLIDPVILTEAFDNDVLECTDAEPFTRPPHLRRLVPDSELLRRRATGESLRTIARDYGVAHSTLARFFARPEIKWQLRETKQQLRAESRAQRLRATHARYANGDGGTRQ